MDIAPSPKYSNSKFPLFPPTTEPERAQSIVRSSSPTDEQGRYWHWDKLRKLTPPQDWSVEEWWAGMKWVRNRQGRHLPFVATSGAPFVLVTPACVHAQLSWLDQKLGRRGVPIRYHLDDEGWGDLAADSRKQEAKYSTVLEGAGFESESPESFLQADRKPLPVDEGTLRNSCKALEYIRENSHSELTPEGLRELHRILVLNSSGSPRVSGRFRAGTEDASFLETDQTNLWHDPPMAAELEERVFRICSFANSDPGLGAPIHPIVRSILLHLIFLYDRPFSLANGRLARVLFYWSMLKNGYKLAELVSISEVLAAAPGQYERSFRYVISDENDATYFVIHQLDVLIKALQNLGGRLEGEGSPVEVK